MYELYMHVSLLLVSLHLLMAKHLPPFYLKIKKIEEVSLANLPCNIFHVVLPLKLQWIPLYWSTSV